jgi:hypothetical protein
MADADLTYLGDNDTIGYNLTNETADNTSWPSNEGAGGTLIDNNLYIEIINGYVQPVVCAFGILGNMLNLIVLSRKRFTTSMDSMERTVQMCLIALAVSDMMFCLVALPQSVLKHPYISQSMMSFLLFKFVETPLVNTFILTSTWLTVSMTIGRYIVVCHPLHARSIVDAKCTRSAIISVYVISIGINMPRYWMKQIYPVRCILLAKYGYIDSKDIDFNDTCYLVDKSKLGRDLTFLVSYTSVMFVIGFVIPLLILIYCNAHLIRALNRARRIQRQITANAAYRQQKDRLTPTLITIIIMFFVMVAPGEIYMYIHIINKPTNLFSTDTIFCITNTLNLINYSMNFVLYCAVNASFRKTLRSMVIHHCMKQDPRLMSINPNYSVNTYQTVSYTAAPAHRAENGGQNNVQIEENADV